MGSIGRVAIGADGAIARLIICRLTRFHRRSPHSICERFKLSLAASPCITRGRGGWLGLTPWKTCTSYPLPAFLAHSRLGQGSLGSEFHDLEFCVHSSLD